MDEKNIYAVSQFFCVVFEEKKNAILVVLLCPSVCTGKTFDKLKLNKLDKFHLEIILVRKNQLPI